MGVLSSKSNLQNTTEITRLCLKTGIVNLDILHVGTIPLFLESYIISNNIFFSVITDKHVNENEVDIVLVNNDSMIGNKILKTIDSLKLIVTYTKTLYIKSGHDFIHFSLIPILLKYLIKIKESISVFNKKVTQNTSEVFLEKVTKTIDENIDNHSLNMNKLSDLLYMSRSALSKKIKTYTGLKPTEFINQYKLEKSKHLLVVTNWQISRISDALGFSSQQYYCRLFKKTTGVNPSNYRIENQKV